MRELSAAQLRRYKHKDANGAYKAEQLTAPRFSPTRTVEWRGVHPGANRQWRFGIDELERLFAAGRILCRRDGRPRKDGLREYLHESEGAPVQDVWTDIPRIGNTASERIGYPTQKPLVLLERIIQASSNEGDVVLDPFCGCATACIAAERLGRQWIGIDLSAKAVELVQHRLKQQEPGIALWASKVVARTDIPQRTDIAAPKNYRQNKHVLYGQQEGRLQRLPYGLPVQDHGGGSRCAAVKGRGGPPRESATPLRSLQQGEGRRGYVVPEGATREDLSARAQLVFRIL